MATLRWKSGAVAISQVSTWTFAGTWLSTETITVTIGSKSITVTTGATVIADILTTLQSALSTLDAESYPEFAEVAWSKTSSTIIGTANDPGVPFTATITTNSGSGTIDGGAGDSGVATVASSGPFDWSTAANWDSGTVPVNSDAVWFENSDVPVKYGLAQSGVTLASLNIGTTYTGYIGLPEVNADKEPYPEYRPQYLAIGATACNIGNGAQGGQGTGRIKLNTGTAQTTLTVTFTGSPLEQDVEPVQWKGTHASNVVSVFRGSVAVAGYASDTATVATLNVGYMTSQGSDANVRVGAGCTLTTVNQSGGSLYISCAATTVTQTAGSLVLRGTAAYTTLTVGGSLVYLSSGTITTLTVTGGGSVDFGQDMRARTCTNATLYSGATLNDPFGTVTFSNAFLLSRCRVGEVTLDVGQNRHLLPS